MELLVYLEKLVLRGKLEFKVWELPDFRELLD
jgi:hypothetical protein